MKRQWKFIVVLVLGAIGLITDNVLHIPGIAEVLFDIAGVYVSISLAREMFGDLKEGHWGIDVMDDPGHVYWWRKPGRLRDRPGQPGTAGPFGQEPAGSQQAG